ncbi:hypothetical protein PybrP1_007264, partial [[Pythium] brassicae (nom. inval.)]
MVKSLLHCAALLAVAATLATAQQGASEAPAASPSPTPPPSGGPIMTPSPNAPPSASPTPTSGGSPAAITVSAACGANARLKVEGSLIVLMCNNVPQSGALTIGAFAELEVGVEPPSMLFIDALTAANIDKLDKLNIHGGPVGSASFTGTPPTVESISRITFANASVKLKLPDKVAYLDLLSNKFSKLPALLYERRYPIKIAATITFTNSSPEFLPRAAVENLVNNIDTSTSTIDIDAACDATIAADLSNAGKKHICTDPLSVTPAPPPNPNATPTPVSGSANAHGSNSGGSSHTTVIVVIVAVSVVVVVLAATLWRKLVARKKQASQHDDNAVNLIGKDDASGAGKLSFISGDESLRALRLQQHEVTLSKSLGPGVLWLGEYNGGKVVVKRVEAESSDAYVAKNLMSQAQVLAPLAHENLVTLVGVTWLAGTDFAVVAEFMDKSNLKTVLADANWQLDLHTRLRMGLDVARGLAYLHAREQPLYVRNFSSRKVLVNSSSECKLSLFECYPSAMRFEPLETYGSGDVAWVAPELITRSAPQDPCKINVYALGVVLCEVLARAAPFQSLAEAQGNTLSDVAIVAHIRRHEPLAPHEGRREYMRAPQSLRDAIDRCLALSPLDRPSAADM